MGDLTICTLKFSDNFMENNAERVSLRRIKNIIPKTAEKFNVKIERIILFGSRAKGKAKKYSDWDILIITEKKLDKEIY